MAARFRATLLLTALACMAAAGGSLIPEASPSLVERAAGRWADASLGQLEQGRSVYVKRCSGCHNLHLPSERTPDEWAAALDEMAVKGRLDENQKTAVLRYLSAASAELRQVSLDPLPAAEKPPLQAVESGTASPAPEAGSPTAPASPAVAQSPAPEPAAPGMAAGHEPKN